MSHFAEIKDGVVSCVIVAEQSFIDTLPGEWVQTSYNTGGGVHVSGGTPLRKNFAGVGYGYDGIGFYPPRPYTSWSLNSETYLWEPPTPKPNDGNLYFWSEDQYNSTGNGWVARDQLQ
jgi:hypothetical protein